MPDDLKEKPISYLNMALLADVLLYYCTTSAGKEG